MPFRLAVFDFDGTLADSASWMRAALDTMAVKHRFKRVGDDEVEALRALGTREILAYLGISWWKLPLIARDMRAMSQASAAELRLFEGVPALLATLAERGVHLAILTSNAEATVRTVLGPSASLVRHYACGASLFGKSRKLAALLRRTHTPPEHVLCLGDEIRDIDAARAVGARAAAVTWGFASAAVLRAHHPDHLLTRVDEIAPLFVSR